MEVSMRAAALSLLYSILVGGALGAVYDVIRFVRVLFHTDVRNPYAAKRHFPLLRTVFVAIGDFLFFAVAAVTMCIFFFLTGDGIVRGYALLGALGGFLLYYHTVGALFIRICEKTAAFVRKMTVAALRMAAKPVCAAGRRIKKQLSPIVTRLRSVYNKRREAYRSAKAAKQNKKRMRGRTDLCRNGAPKKKE